MTARGAPPPATPPDPAPDPNLLFDDDEEIEVSSDSEEEDGASSVGSSTSASTASSSASSPSPPPPPRRPSQVRFAEPVSQVVDTLAPRPPVSTPPAPLPVVPPPPAIPTPPSPPSPSPQPPRLTAAVLVDDQGETDDPSPLSFVSCLLLVLTGHAMALRASLNRSHPVRYTLCLLLAYSVLAPLLIGVCPSVASVPFRIGVAVAVLLLDWFSFHQDLSRFSEVEACLFGNCRRNSMITGLLAHGADVASVCLLAWPLASTRLPPVGRVAMAVFVGTYTLVGAELIVETTKEGSRSDLRGRSEAAKCREARLMRNSWRGALNDLITVLGVLAAWQGMLAGGETKGAGGGGGGGDDRSSSSSMSAVSALRASVVDPLRDAAASVTKTPSVSTLLVAAKVVFVDVGGMLVAPLVANYLNTSHQHGRTTAEDYGLPDCFDDPEDVVRAGEGVDGE